MYWNETPTRLTCGSVNCEKAPLCCDTGQKVVSTIHFRDRKNIVEYSEIKRFETSKNRKNIVEYSEIKRFETSQMNNILIPCP